MAKDFLKVRTGLTVKPNAAPGSPENGDIYYDSGTNQFNFYQNGALVQLSGGGGGGSGTALSKAIAQTAHGFSVGNAIYYTGTAYAKAQANADSTSEVVGIVSAVADANNFTVTMDGYVSGLSGLTAGSTYYLDYSTAGGLTSTEPLQTGYISKPVLIADSTTSGYVIQSRGIANGQGISLPMSDWASYTPTYSASLGTVTASNMFWRRVGDSLELKGQFTIGSTTGVVATMSLPNSLVIDSSKDPIKRVQGIYYRTVSGGVGNKGGPTIVDPGLSVLKFSDDQFIGSTTVNALTDGFGSNMGNSGDTINVDVTGIPISGWSSGGGTSPLLSLSDWQVETGITAGSFTGLGTVTNVSAYSRRVGDTMFVRGTATAGTVTATAAKIALPKTLDSSKISSSSNGTLTGHCFTAGTSTGIYSANQIFITFYDGSDTASMYVAHASTASGYSKDNGSAIFNSNQTFEFDFAFPVAGWTSTSSGTLTAPRSEVQLNSGNGHGSTNTFIRRFSTTLVNTGSAITYADSATLGASFTINETGIYSMSYTDTNTSTGCTIGFSKNTSQGSTSIASITDANIVQLVDASGATVKVNVSATTNLIAGDVIRPHTDANPNGTSNVRTRFIITKVSN